MYVFFIIGLFTIGGGYATMIEDQVVSRGWMSMEELLNFFAIAESTPGPFAVNTATLVGYQQAGVLGAITATISVVLPSFIIILIIAKFINNFLKYKKIQGGLDGIKAIIVGLIFSVLISLFLTNVFGGYKFNNFDYIALIIIITLLTLKLIIKKISPILLICLSGR